MGVNKAVGDEAAFVCPGPDEARFYWISGKRGFYRIYVGFSVLFPRKSIG